ncbi:MAG TPA: signal recognition particle-docking protein FtsY, partial [Bacteroidales bacterium]|nr:signal recognition particle-docking protein FtsY [Bacteroidales bacterium]
MGLFSFLTKDKKQSLDKGLEKTKEAFFSRLSRAIIGKTSIDDEVL